MPKEQVRKRGKRKTKAQEEEAPAPVVAPTTHVADPEPSTSTGLHPARAAMLAGRPMPRQAPAPEAPRQEGEEGAEGAELAEGDGIDGQADWTRGPRTESEFPFGILDPDVKAYFRSIEDQIKDWEGVSSAGEEREADRQIFLSSVLSELRGHELSASTDPETSIILERLLPSLNDWGRRVIGDSFGDKWDVLLRHRFSSHVVQTWITLAADTLDREARDVWPPQQASQDISSGQLPTMSDLITSIVSLLLPSIPQLVSSPYASPPIRLLMLVLTPKRALPALGEGQGDESGIIRSKRSGKWRKGQDVKGKSILGEDVPKDKSKRKLPKELKSTRKEIRVALMENLEAAEWKAMAANAVGCPTVQLVLEFEVDDKEVEKEGSLFDTLTEGLVSQLASGKTEFEAQPFLLSLLASQTGTRPFESLLQLSPAPVFGALWKTYFEGKLGKLAGHPYANFVVAKGVSRLGKDQVEELIKEVKGNSGGRGLIKAARTSVIQALVDRSLTIPEIQKPVLQLIFSCLELPATSQNTLVPCLMTLKTFPMYQALITGEPLPLSAWQNRRTARPKDDLAPNIQGCLILQAMVGMGQANASVLDSLTSLPVDALITYAKSPIASRLLDKVFIDPAAPIKYRKKLMMVFMDHYKQLVEDKLGSRVVDTIWDRADGFMKEKIARSLIPHLTSLGGSQYGKYFVRRADIVLLNRRPEEWREKILALKHHFAHQKEPAEEVKSEVKEKKRKEQRDDIDDLFDAAENKKRKTA
ncbi:hypothetical protein L198_00750 [Cryptococcus wingfieldii CBS 7118]|uniref:Nucleolar protein 9 n=1 Tax=Cryptococcus wingfieldii CBS 7118 TaxID=1295528 RepID=A0A1E3K2D7_9TREE|nr:hypothetical protein L198_00750 [Cryptococcus wingfieldii CBS 7118]ODO07171.1 hypothetical protein L198_00750 [Cryptococcus wingfieldii CBS 7118]